MRISPRGKIRKRQRRRQVQRRGFVETLERRQLLTTLVWSSGPALPAPRTVAVAVVTPDHAVRLLGGQSPAATVSPVLGVNATAWTTGQTIDTPRNDLGAAVLDQAVYLFGGTGNTEGMNEVLNYDYRFGDSQDVAKMNTVRYDFGFADDAAGHAYALGGIGVFQDGQIWAQAERFDPVSNRWVAIAAMPEARHGMTAIGDHQGHLFVFGGSTTLDDSGIQAASYRYDIATDSWSTIAAMPTPSRDSAAVQAADGQIYVTGGVTAGGATAVVQAYDPATNAWVAQTSLPQPTYSHAAALDAAGRILVAGGFDSSGTAVPTVYRTQRLNDPETQPKITSSPVVNGSLDKPYGYDVDATGNPNPTYSLITGPQGMRIDATSGLIAWQPVDGQLGDHTVTVRASNHVGNAEQSFSIHVVRDTIAPTPPANLSASQITEASVTLGWSPSTDAVGVDHYDVYSVVHRRARWRRWNEFTLAATVAGDQTATTVTGLAPLSSHNYVVRAVDAAGNTSNYSTEVSVTLLSAPDLRFWFGNQTSGTVTSTAEHGLKLSLVSRANPAATFSMVSGPATMTVDSVTGQVAWTPAAADVGINTATFRARNSVGAADLNVVFDIQPDVPQLSVTYNPNTGGQRYALAGTLFTAQINDASNTPSSYQLVSGPAGMSLDAQTGLVSWTPLGNQGGTQAVVVRGTNAAGTTDLPIDLQTLFTGAVSNVSVTGTTLLFPTAHWSPPTGEGAQLVHSYDVLARARYRWGRAWRTHQVRVSVPAGTHAADLNGLLTGKVYTLTITPMDTAGNPGLAHTGTTFSSVPALPQISWQVNGYSNGATTAGPVIAAQPAEIVLQDLRADPSTLTMTSGPAGMTFDPTTRIAKWIPSPADVTTATHSTTATFRAENNVGFVDVTVPIRVHFSGAVQNATAIKDGNTATVRWNPPTDNVNPIAGYNITAHWTWQGRRRSRSWRVGNVTSVTYSLIPTGAVVHTGASVVPIDAAGNLGVSTRVYRYGAPPNNSPPVANDDSYSVNEDAKLVTSWSTGVLHNDTDADGNSLSAYLVTRPAHGTLSFNTTGAFTYTPQVNFNGADTFTYRAYDGKFASANATVTINVTPVNDAPTALDDYYVVDQDAVLTVATPQGVLVNDSDVDGDVLSSLIVAQPLHGTLSLDADGAFVYTPNTGFAGNDAFSYKANDSLLDSRTATAHINVKAPPPAGTKFFVVDFSARGTFEYDAAGALVETYGLPKANKKPLGVAANTEGTLVWVVDKSKRVFVYDNAGTLLGQWVPTGLDKPDGIATDGTNIWIVDRSFDKVFYFAGAANRRNGQIAATSSFALHRANRNPKGITTDGTDLWIVNNRAAVDEVFKYTTSGQLIGRWQIDAANSTPTGITIDPRHVQHVWIVDAGADRVFRYDDGASATTGSVAAAASFPLDARDVNPQGIADPRDASWLPPEVGWQPQSLDQAVVAAHWENPENRLDVNEDDRVTPLDALMVINHLNARQETEVLNFDDTMPFLDATADGQITPLDALLVINALNARRSSAEATVLEQAVTELAATDLSTVGLDTAIESLTKPG